MDKNLGKGHLLVATAQLMDPNFQKTVVLICEHKEEGSYGLVLNRKIPDWNGIISNMPFVKGRLLQGGPVQMDVMQVVHPYGDKIPGCFSVIPGVWLGGDFDRMVDGFESGELAPEKCLFFMGYSGWGAGQLAEEFKTGSWVSLQSTPELILETDSDNLWRVAIKKRMNGNPLFKDFPENPDWN